MAACLHHPGVPAFARDAVGRLQAAVDKRRDAQEQWNGRQIVSRERELLYALQKLERRWRQGAFPPTPADAVREPVSSAWADEEPLPEAEDSALPISEPQAWGALAQRLAVSRQAQLPDRASPAPGLQQRAEPRAWAALGPEWSLPQAAALGWRREP
jgi:hypothetical protein